MKKKHEAYHCPQKSAARAPAAFSSTATAVMVNFMAIGNV
jgi:hypothetical protein